MRHTAEDAAKREADDGPLPEEACGRTAETFALGVTLGVIALALAVTTGKTAKTVAKPPSG